MTLHDQKKYPGIIAIDGPAASGKSTLGKKIAHHLGYLYFDTGIMYRAATLAALQSGIPLENEQLVTALAEEIQIEVFPPTCSDGRINDVLLNGVDVTWEIRSPVVESKVSLVSTYPGVRKAMTEQQRVIGRRGSTIMVGRDIGTVVFPEAEMKIYLDASVQERSKRRYKETNARGAETSLEDISSSMLTRDKIDSTRVVAPLKPADDAVIINTDGMNEEEVFITVMKLLGIDINK